MPPDLSRTRMFGATTAVAAQPASAFQSSFSQPSNATRISTNHSTFPHFNAIAPTSGNQQTTWSALVPRQTQGQGGRGNPPPSANQVGLVADDDQQGDHCFMRIDKDEPPSLGDVGYQRISCACNRPHSYEGRCFGSRSECRTDHVGDVLIRVRAKMERHLTALTRYRANSNYAHQERREL